MESFKQARKRIRSVLKGRKDKSIGMLSLAEQNTLREICVLHVDPSFYDQYNALLLKGEKNNEELLLEEYRLTKEKLRWTVAKMDELFGLT